MNRDEILAALNAEIDHLTAVRDLMSGRSQAETSRRPGQPKGSSKKTTSLNLEELVPGKTRSMSAEGKARIAEAQRKRWAAQKSKPAKKASSTAATPVRKSAAVAKKAIKRVAKPTSAKVAPKKPATSAQTKKEASAGTE